PIEVIEARFPVRVTQYGLRRGSGGRGVRKGGDGLVRCFRFLAPTQVTLLTERRVHPPWGSAGGQPGEVGINTHNGKSLPAKVALWVEAGDSVAIETPGGGGWGSVPG
ncbi:MAG: hydantoinase B/oxoprolinase family protein, partial [Candidatus Thiodiazotropha sp.]